ncbi:hypothetical protein [Peredibacter starrii]|uniref:Uncharacterized protein n=1 Tax=Peredibacter starrii TaxID=28202 RepID=A0AAX4HL90_9BACT|nr:hypothetical protein [Peredibacter starrii]WPU64087.1 hypothetical protein SOO65_15445 [Peredibacter starrii]
MVYLFLLPLLFTNVFATDEIQSGIAVINELNGGVNSNQCTEQSILMDRCAIDLCGRPENLPSDSLNDRSFNKYVQPKDMQRFAEIKDDLQKLVEMEIDRTNGLVQGLKKDFDREKLKAEIESAEPWQMENLASRFLYPFFQVSTDYTKPLEERLTYSLQLPSDASDVLKKGLDSYINHRKSASLSSYSVGIQEGLYTPEESKKILKAEWDKFNKALEERKKTNPESMKSFADQIENFTQDLKDPSFEENGNYENMAGSLQQLSDGLQSEVLGKWPDVPFNHCQADCKKAIFEEMDRYDHKGILQSLQNKLKDKKLLTKKKMAYCKSQFAMDSINSYQKDKLIKMIPGIKAALFKNVMSGYSKESQKEFKDYLDKQVQFSTKPVKSVAGEFIQEVKRTVNFEKSKSRSTETKASSLIDRTLDLMGYVDYDGNTAPLSQMRLCSESLSYVAWDNFTPKSFRDPQAPPDEYAGQDPEKDNLNISIFSCTNQEHGKNIVAHELGHALSWAFLENKLSEKSYKEYMNLRSCANGLYKVQNDYEAPASFVHDQDRFRVEEDTADLIGYMTIPDKSLISNCTLLEVSEDGKSFENLELLNSRNSDTHSSGLMRVLQEAIHKRRALPASCKELVNANKDLYRFEPCY